MTFFIHTLFMVSFVWMTLHFWRQLPLQEGETLRSRNRDFVEWAAKGVAVPLFLWIVMNIGLTTLLPPFLPEVAVVKNAGGFWPWAVLRYTSPAMSVIVSYWAALSLAAIALMIRARTDDRPRFNGTALMWTVFMLPVCAVVLLIAGWAGIGFALVVWLAPVVHGTLPNLARTRRAPSYSQAIGKLKFGKYSEAELEILRELELCENDFNGWMMLAELYAVHFQDFKLAEQTVIDLCEQPDVKASDACVALHRLADWYLRLQNDPQGARRCMEAISKRYPNTHLSRMARLRMKRLPQTTEEWIEESRGKPLHLPALHDDFEGAETAEPVDLQAVQRSAERLSDRLGRDPNDAAAREEFARALAKLGKLQPAIDQLDLLLSMEGQSTTRRAEWMGLKVAWLTQITPDSPAVRTLLSRIIQEFPFSPQAMAAQRRVFLMDERARVAKYAKIREKPRIVVRLDDNPKKASKSTPNNS